MMKEVPQHHQAYSLNIATQKIRRSKKIFNANNRMK